MPALPYPLIYFGSYVLSTQINQVLTTLHLFYFSIPSVSFVCVYIYFCVCEYMWKPETDIGCLPCFPPCVLRHGLSLHLELASLARFSGQWLPGNLNSWNLNWNHRCNAHTRLFNMDAGDMNSVYHTFMASTLPTEQSFQPTSVPLLKQGYKPHLLFGTFKLGFSCLWDIIWN